MARHSLECIVIFVVGVLGNTFQVLLRPVHDQTSLEVKQLGREYTDVFKVNVVSGFQRIQMVELESHYIKERNI